MAWAVAEAARCGQPRPQRAAQDLVRLLDRHVVKEETGLYPELIAREQLSAEQLGDLEAEHRDLRQALVSGGFGRRDFYASAAHIEVEEMELFSAAMLSFDDEEWDAMDDAHDRAAQQRLVLGP